MRNLKRTQVSELLGIEYPIFQGAMAHIARYELVSAFSEAGGLGIISGGGLSAEELRYQIREVKKRTNKPFGVNLMLMMPTIPKQIKVVVEEGVKIVTTGAGSPKKYMNELKEAEVKVIPVVPSAELAQKMALIGVNAIIAEGSEAGGHIGEMSTMALIPQVVDSVNIPVIAAGGIGDGRGLAAVYALGAQGAQIGTALLTTNECPVPETVKEAVLVAKGTDAIVTGRKNGAPVRSLKNKMTLEYLALEDGDMGFEEFEKLTLGSLKKAVYDGDIENGSIMAGQVCGLVNHQITCQKLIQNFFSDAAVIFTS